MANTPDVGLSPEQAKAGAEALEKISKEMLAGLVTLHGDIRTALGHQESSARTEFMRMFGFGADEETAQMDDKGYYPAAVAVARTQQKMADLAFRYAAWAKELDDRTRREMGG